MNKRNQAFLWKRFAPFLPDKKTLTPENSCMYWGFAVGDGWYQLVKQLLLDIEKLYRLYPDDFKGFRIEQVKEKFGGLRFYVNHYPNCGVPDVLPTVEFFEKNPLAKLIADAEEASFTICEDCGSDGKLRQDRSWVRTLCDGCSKRDLIKKIKGRRFWKARLKELGI